MTFQMTATTTSGGRHRQEKQRPPDRTAWNVAVENHGEKERPDPNRRSAAENEQNGVLERKQKQSVIQ